MVVFTGDANRTRVRQGRGSVNTIEILEGLEIGDEVIGPDRAAFRVWCTLPDGRRIIEHVIIHYADGKITRQVDVEAWD